MKAAAMTDPGQKPSLGIFGSAVEIARALVAGMPPGLLVVCMLFGGLVWFLDAHNDQRAQLMMQRTELVGRLLTTCLERLSPPVR